MHILVLSCPLTPETLGLIGGAELDLLPRGSSVFNIARSGVMDYATLSERLLSGQIAGAILDVFDQEPLPEDSFLWDVPNLIISPHVSCDDATEYVDRCLAIFSDNLSRLLGGRPLVNVVDGARGY